MNRWIGSATVAALAIAGAISARGTAQVDPLIERGRYLVGFGHLGPRGTETPADLPPNIEPKTPFIWIVPQHNGQGSRG